MRVALPIWAGRVSPVFDVSRRALILTITEGQIVSRVVEPIDTPTLALKSERLVKLGIDCLVCGAITATLEHALSMRGIRVIAFVAGGIAEVEQSILNGTLPNPKLCMPGCHRRQRRCRHGRGG